MLLTGRELRRVTLSWTPAGNEEKTAEFELEDITVSHDGSRVKCAVRKDAGDDIDVTDGMLIYSELSRLEDGSPDSGETGPYPDDMDAGSEASEKTVEKTDDLSEMAGDDGVIPMRWDRAADLISSGEGMAENTTAGRRGRFILADGKKTHAENKIPSSYKRFVIKGGDGIGVVTEPGLDQSPGEYAINSGPRRMITEAVEAVCEECEYEGRLLIVISIPGGQEAAEKTFNERVGVKGGLSVLGTTGIVEPMSGRAVADTVRAEVRVKGRQSDFLAFVPGNTGAEFVNDELKISDSRTVIISNYPGAAIDEAVQAGVKGILMAGSLGKFVKLAGGIFNTHSHEADARMDILIRCALEAGASLDILRRVDGCVTTEAAVDILEAGGLLDDVMDVVIRKAAGHVRRRAADMDTEIIMLRNSGGVLAFTDGAFDIWEKYNE